PIEIKILNSKALMAGDEGSKNSDQIDLNSPFYLHPSDYPRQMQKEIRASVKYANTAAEIWKGLKERFGKESVPRAYELKQVLNVTQQDRVTVSAYFTKLRRIWDEINTVLPTPRCTCNGCRCEVGKKLVELKEKERLY
nr:hypothetical protein [Tanacetum cinerariifolium]